MKKNNIMKRLSINFFAAIGIFIIAVLLHPYLNIFNSQNNMYILAVIISLIVLEGLKYLSKELLKSDNNLFKMFGYHLKFVVVVGGVALFIILFGRIINNVL